MLKLFENNSWMPLINIGGRFIRSKFRSRFKILRNCKNFFLKENSLFFVRLRLHTVNETIFQKVPFAVDYSALPLIYTCAASDLPRNIRSKTQRQIEYLKFSCWTRTDSRRILSMDFTSSVRILKSFLEKNSFSRYWKSSTGSDSDKTDLDTIYSSSVKKQTRSLQTILKLNSFFNLLSDSVNQKVHAFDWITTLAYNTAVTSRFNRQVTSTAGSTVDYQFNPQKSYKPENSVLAPNFHAIVQPARKALNYVKTYSFSSAFRYLEFLKLASEFALLTRNMAVDYYRSDSYLAYHYSTLNQKIDSKTEFKRKKHYHFEINRLLSALHNHLFLKHLEMTTCRLSSDELLKLFSVQNVSFSPSVQFLITNFLKKTASLLGREHLSVTESNGVSLKTNPKNKEGSLQFSKYTPDFPSSYIQNTTKLLSLIRYYQLIHKNGILNTESASLELESASQDHKSKNIVNSYGKIVQEKRNSYSQSRLQKIFELLKFPVSFRTLSEADGENKVYSWRIQATRAYNSTAIYMPEQIVYRLSDHQVSHHYMASYQKVENKRELKTKKRLLVQINRLNSKHVKPFFMKTLETNTYKLKRAELLSYRDTHNFTSSVAVNQIYSLKNAYMSSLQQNLPLSTILSIPLYTGKHPNKAQLSSCITSIQNYPESLAFSYKKTYPFEYSAVLIRNLKVSVINFLAVHNSFIGKLLHSSATLNNEHLEKMTLLEKRTDMVLSGLSRSFLKKRILQPFFSGVFLRRNILKLFKISYSPSETNAPATIEYIMTLSNRQNSVSRGKSSLNSLFSERSFNVSVPLLSQTDGVAFGKRLTPFFNLLRRADTIIFQSPVFAGKPEFSSNKGSQSSKPGAQESKAAFFSCLAGAAELNGQKALHWEAARMNLILGSGKREYRSAEYFLQRDSANFLNKEKRSRQVNKKQDAPAVSRIIQRIPFDFILSTTLDIASEIKWKEVLFSINGKEKKPGDEKDVSKNFFSRFKNLQSPKNASKSSIYPESKNAYPTFFTLREEGGKIPRITNFGTFEEERSKLTHAGENSQKAGREGLIYGTSEPLFEEVKKIKRIISETREIVADHLGSHMPQTTGNSEQVMDIEDVSERVIQMINRRLKIEAERRGIF
ncbi:MAG: hypothetical protein ACM3KN_00050 [Candidatus Aminicenantes bacterium]